MQEARFPARFMPPENLGAPLTEDDWLQGMRATMYELNAASFDGDAVRYEAATELSRYVVAEMIQQYPRTAMLRIGDYY